ncbi:hypothetical protein Xhom_00974 [Xenorhabdus hominickii]|uniref:Uncharacterized protein n=1 Tax=Xenorhabdus hominickii TaxID=351679 RepID=A0A2G0QFH2_XENHO|nr:hypothetical protein Xhom_00974 [Xenorhabdus hominickii]
MLGAVGVRQPAVVVVAIAGHHVILFVITTAYCFQLTVFTVQQRQCRAVTVIDAGQTMFITVVELDLITVHILQSPQLPLQPVLFGRYRHGEMLADRIVTLLQTKTRPVPAQREGRMLRVLAALFMRHQHKVKAGAFGGTDSYLVTIDYCTARKSVSPVFTQQPPFAR